MNRTLRTFVALGLGIAALGAAAPSGHAQAVTTSTIMGRVTDGAGSPLEGVQVVIENEATGAQHGILTRSGGRYVMPGLRPGGPYRVQARIIGYGVQAVEDITLALGERRDIDFVLRAEAVAIEGIQVITDRLAARTGVGTVVDERAVRETPALGRDIADYTRLTPQAYVENDDDDGPAISIAGQNNRYNSIFIDGAVSNDVFGLSAQGTNGGQTGATPISLDAIEQFQIAISPFDVTQSGFTGGAINAITRSGTNRFEGSAYYQGRNESLAGLTPTNDPNFDRQRLPDFTNARYGFRLGGPILENKLFFFVNAELLRAQTPQPFNVTYTGESAGRLDEIRNVLMEELGYDPGDPGDKASTLDDNKFLGKLDWNIGSAHRLTARHSYSQSDNLDEFTSGERSINFSNNAEAFPNTTNSTAVELNSTFGPSFANKLVVGYTTVRDDRDITGQPFPFAQIDDGAGRIFLGSERFSTANVLDQDIFTITNNFNWFSGAHTFTFGTHNEFYSISNLFIPFNFGWYFFGDRNRSGTAVDEFLQAVCAAGNRQNGQVRTSTCQQFGPDFEDPLTFVLRGYSLVGDPTKVGDESENVGAFDAYQLGVYVQDEYRASDRLRLTAGVRLDVPKVTTNPRFAPDVFDTTLPAVEQFHELHGARPGRTPAAQLYFSPRLGFNYDAQANGATVLRGGVGVFTGRVPFVWPGGMFLNNGANTGIFARFGRNEFRPDPSQGLRLDQDPIPSGRLEIFEEDFRYPSVLRSSLGLDQRLPYGFVGTLEGQYTKTLSNVTVTNVNLRPANRTLAGPDQRPIIAYGVSRGEIDYRANLIDPRYQAIHRVGSTSEGYTYDITASLGRQFGENLDGRISYTYGDAFSINDGTSSQINSIWAFNENVEGLNNLSLARSDFSIGQRILGLLNYRQEFLRNLGTTVSMVYTGETGRPFSYTIGNSRELTGENTSDVSLFYVPNNASELTFVEYTSGGVTFTPQQQAAELEEFINGNEYLSSRRGTYAERNADRTPFENVVDLRVAQEVFANVAGRRNGVALTLDIFNFTNLLNKDWGRRYERIFQYDVIRFEGFRDIENGDFTPEYTFRLQDIDNEAEIFDRRIADFGNYSSRWLMQLGVRYTF